MTLLPIPTCYEGYEGVGYLEGLPLLLDGDNSEYLGSIMSSGRFRTTREGVRDISASSNPFRSISADANPLWGQGFPSISVYRSAASEISWGVTGPLGETRVIDKGLLQISVNDESFEGTSLAIADGDEIKLRLVGTNFELGGIPGMNVTECGLKIEDATSVLPTVQSFRTAGSDDNATVEFEKPGDGRVEIYGGLFTQSKSASGVTYYECAAPAVITLEYAPNGSDEWIPLDVQADPSRDFMPGWGKYYAASLASIDRESANDWFDLRLTMKGEKGEYTIQTVSPAFKIENDSSISDTLTGTSVVRTIYHDLGGRLAANPGAGVYIRTDILTDGTRRVTKTVR